jgi:ABC-2 type transport system ATP-binding protein
VTKRKNRKNQKRRRGQRGGQQQVRQAPANAIQPADTPPVVSKNGHKPQAGTPAIKPQTPIYRTQFTTEHDPILEMCEASLDFGENAGVFDLTFELPHGTILGLIGPSGCGKTTSVRLLNGIYKPTGGEVRVFGRSPLDFSQEEKAAIGYIPQHFILYPNLSVDENLHFLGGIYSMPFLERRAKIKSLLEFIELSDAHRRLGRQLSGGMQRRLMLAGALLHDPLLIFADEPTAGIDPILRSRIWENFRELRQQGRTILVTTQYVGEAAYCDLVAVMRRGRLLTMDTPDGLRRQALGGDAIRLEVEHSQVLQVMDLLSRLPGVLSTAHTPEVTGGISTVVDEAGKRLPLFLTALKSQLDVTPQKTEQYVPPFDEVFVRLIQRSEAAE